MSSTVWTFGPAGQYTATWDGVQVVTVTLTSTSAFVASFNAESLTAAMASPEYAELLQGASLPAAAPLSLVATTGVAGFALQNATPTVLSWTAPSDGNLHRVIVFASLHVTSAETGGQVSVGYNAPDGNVASHTLFSASIGVGTAAGTAFNIIVEAGQTVSVGEATALTVGAAILWAEIWGS